MHYLNRNLRKTGKGLKRKLKNTKEARWNDANSGVMHRLQNEKR
jgi:hypothetical protein